MKAPEFSALAAQHVLGDDPAPEMVLAIAAGASPELVWRNDLGGLTFRVGDEFVKWRALGPRVLTAWDRQRAASTRSRVS